MEDLSFIYGSNFAQRKFELGAKDNFSVEFLHDVLYTKPQENIDSIEKICSDEDLTYLLYKDTFNELMIKTHLGNLILNKIEHTFEESGQYVGFTDNENEIKRLAVDLIQHQDLYPNDVFVYYKE